MNSGATKILLWIAIPVLAIGFVAWQWVGFAQEKRRLERGIEELEHDLRMIAYARLKVPNITESIVKEKAVIEELHKRLPREPMVESFVGNLSEQLRGTGVEITRYTSRSLKRDFYDVNDLEIFIRQELSEPRTLKELIKKFERLVAWKEFIPGAPSILRLSIYNLSIYSSSRNLKTPSVKPCPELDANMSGLWPFSTFLEGHKKRFVQLCLDRKGHQAVFLQIKEYQNLREYRVKLEQVVSALSSGDLESKAVGGRGNQGSQTLEAYKNLSIDTHLNVAEFKLENLIKNTESTEEIEKKEKLREAHNLLWEAIRRYEYFRTHDERFLTDNWRENYIWTAASPDTPNLDKSPLSLLYHLRLAYEEAVQIRAQIMVSDRQYTRLESQLNQSLEQSVRLVQETIVAVEESRGWIKYENPDYGIRIFVPPDFSPNTTRENPFPLDHIKTKAVGSPEQAVFVRQEERKTILLRNNTNKSGSRKSVKDSGHVSFSTQGEQRVFQRFHDILYLHLCLGRRCGEGTGVHPKKWESLVRNQLFSFGREFRCRGIR